jgi:hypothetical protein
MTPYYFITISPVQNPIETLLALWNSSATLALISNSGIFISRRPVNVNRNYRKTDDRSLLNSEFGMRNSSIADFGFRIADFKVINKTS